MINLLLKNSNLTLKFNKNHELLRKSLMPPSEKGAPDFPSKRQKKLLIANFTVCLCRREVCAKLCLELYLSSNFKSRSSILVNPQRMPVRLFIRTTNKNNRHKPVGHYKNVYIYQFLQYFWATLVYTVFLHLIL